MVKNTRTVGRNKGGLASLMNRDSAAEGNAAAAPNSSTGGIAGGIAAAEAAAVQRARQVPVASLIPHPYNDPHRSEVGSGEKWDELVASIASQGVLITGKAVSRRAFLKARPEHTDTLPEGEFVLVYGHRRRRAALEAGVETMPVFVDDAILENDGDIDAMAMENLGREDLAPLAEAALFARYIDTLDLNQSKIAKRLGVQQGTISRRLSLLMLTEEATEAVESGRLSPTAAAALGGALPYGPQRAWQRTKREDQNTPERRDDQNTALQQILDHGGSPSHVTELVLTRRQSITTAGEKGIELVDDPSAALGGPAVEIDDQDQHNGRVVGTLDEITGSLLLWGLQADLPVETPADNSAQGSTGGEAPKTAKGKKTSTPDADTPKGPKNAPESAAEPSGDAADAPGPNGGSEAAEAATARLEACAKAATSVPSKSQMAEVLATAVALGLDMSSARVIALADTWPTGDGGEASNAYVAAAAVAWRRLLAAYEQATASAGTSWGQTQEHYLKLLADRVRGYKPTASERRLIHRD